MARALEVPQEGLRAEIEARDGIASREVAAKLVAAGLKEEQAARVGTAWIYHSLASRVQPGFTGVKERLEQTSARVAARAVYRIAVLPAAEGRKTAPGSGELLSRAVRDALGTTFSGVVRGYAPMDLQGSLLRETQQPPDALLGGTVDEAWLESPAPKIERLTTRYESGKVPNLNGNVERLKERWEQSQAQLPESARNVAESEKRRAAVQADLNRAQAEYNGIAARQVTTLQQQQQRDFDLQASGNRVQQAQQKMLFQELETQTMKATHVVIEKDIQDKLDAYLAEPPYVFEPVYRDYVYEKALFEVRATLAARITLRDLASGEAPAETPAAASFTVQDTVIAPFPEAGIAGDPVEIPKDPELLERLAREAAKDLCSKLDGPLRRHGERLLARAAKERTRGDAAAELHYLALAWHARSTVEEARRKELAARVKEISGLDLEGTEVEVPRLPATSLK
ncbi:MAG: hypothetical protein HY293_13725 [Planctomycetes bacterium]|nr:hypothetical protein [Planctomycetota bacterium]